MASGSNDPLSSLFDTLHMDVAAGPSAPNVLPAMRKKPQRRWGIGAGKRYADEAAFQADLDAWEEERTEHKALAAERRKTKEREREQQRDRSGREHQSGAQRRKESTAEQRHAKQKSEQESERERVRRISRSRMSARGAPADGPHIGQRVRWGAGMSFETVLSVVNYGHTLILYRCPECNSIYGVMRGRHHPPSGVCQRCNATIDAIQEVSEGKAHFYLLERVVYARGVQLEPDVPGGQLAVGKRVHVVSEQHPFYSPQPQPQDGNSCTIVSVCHSCNCYELRQDEHLPLDQLEVINDCEELFCPDDHLYMCEHMGHVGKACVFRCSDESPPADVCQWLCSGFEAEGIGTDAHMCCMHHGGGWNEDPDIPAESFAYRRGPNLTCWLCLHSNEEWDAISNRLVPLLEQYSLALWRGDSVGRPV